MLFRSVSQSRYSATNQQQHHHQTTKFYHNQHKHPNENHRPNQHNILQSLSKQGHPIHRTGQTRTTQQPNPTQQQTKRNQTQQTATLPNNLSQPNTCRTTQQKLRITYPKYKNHPHQQKHSTTHPTPNQEYTHSHKPYTQLSQHSYTHLT